MVDPTDYEISEILTQYTPEVAYLPWTDEMAWDQYPALRWIYDKKDLVDYLAQEIPETDRYVHKPRINFHGLGIGATVFRDKETLPGIFSMPFIPGDLYSTDFLVLDGQFLGSFTFMTKNDPDALHDKGLWVGMATPSEELKTALHKLILEHFSTYTGMLNVEYIMNGKVPCVIEMHLRPSAQFYWCAPEIVIDWINIMAGGKPSFPPSEYSSGGVGSLVIRDEMDFTEPMEGLHIMRLNPEDDYEAVAKRQYLVSGPLALIRSLYKSQFGSAHPIVQPASDLLSRGSGQLMS